jgi:hypothetical protein
MSDKDKTAFEQAGAQSGGSLMAEFWAMMKQNKKYWLIPIIVMLLLLSLLVILGGSAAAPFIYTLF